MNTAGYSVGTHSLTNANHRFSANFSQHFSKLKENTSPNKLSSKNHTAHVQAYSRWLHGLLSTTLSAVYSYGSHSVEHFYPEEDRSSTGDFYTHTYGMALHIDGPRMRFSRNLSFVPFIENIGIRSQLSSFTESGDYARHFSMHHPLYNWVAPVGVKSIFQTYSGLHSSWEAEVAYQPTLYRQRPSVMTRLLASNGTWVTKGTPVSRQAVSYKLAHRALLSSNLLLLLDYRGSWSSSTLCNSLYAHSSLAF